MNKFEEIYGVDTKKIKEWLKKNAVTIVITFVVGFCLGWIKASAAIEMDCKYAKAFRVGSSAYECRRIL